MIILEEAILRGDADGVHEALVLDVMDNIADLVIRGEGLPQIDLNETIVLNEGHEMAIHTKSDGEHDDELPELEVLNYDSDHNTPCLLNRPRGRNQKKATIGVTTRSKKSY